MAKPVEQTSPAVPPPLPVAFVAGLLFCFIAPTVLAQIAQVLRDALGYVVQAFDPWNMFGPGASFSDTPLRELQGRKPIDWIVRLSSAGLCALLWCLAHIGRGTLVSGWLFILLAIGLPILVIPVGSPIYAYTVDPQARETFHAAVGLLLGGILNPALWLPAISAFATFLLKSFAWAHTSLNPRIQSPVPLLTCLSVYLPLVVTTWLFARMVWAYATWRNASTLVEVLRAMRADMLGLVIRPARNIAWLSGLNDRNPPTRSERVARAVAGPWLIPAVCGFAFIVVNQVFNLFPLFLALIALIAYGVTSRLWRIGERLNITSYRLGGAILGCLCGIVAMIICSFVSIQSWAFVLQAGPKPKLGVLISYMPAYIATIVSIGRGLRVGWHSHDALTPQS